ncbi:hypothetical protein IFM89_032095 [Coptis chinensis]|uniref:Ribosomal protein L25 beta domain-containing protein n=1 Tax=Coptis chinensis TaxID=261450 RepID=A0A835M5G4_9MAGN|nr:hypothetical protein IFM89_032095 [Coptis chinensis]
MERLFSAGLKRVVLNHIGKTSASSFLSYHTIQAVPREYTGPRISGRERSQGKIPTVVFTQDQQDPNKPISRKQLLTTERKQINAILKSVELPYFCSTTFQLQIRAGAGSSCLIDSGTVLPIKIHRDPETGSVLNLVLVWANEGSELNVNVPVVFKGVEKSPGIQKESNVPTFASISASTLTQSSLRNGGYLHKIREQLLYQCPAEHIPPKVEVDVSNLDIEDGVYVDDLKVHPSLQLLSKNEKKPICKVMGTKPKVVKPKKKVVAKAVIAA